jgi:hypothetical protein
MRSLALMMSLFGVLCLARNSSHEFEPLVRAKTCSSDFASHNKMFTKSSHKETSEW